MKFMYTIFAGAVVLAAGISAPKNPGKREVIETPQASTIPAAKPQQGFSTSTVSDVVTKALAFKASLTTTQQTTLEKTYTAALARRWSNLPCGSGCRNGIQFSALNSTQLGLALQVIQAAAGTASNEGYDEFNQIRLAEEVLQATAGGNNYDSSIYFISFLNTPSTTSGWMLQYGGHHYAFNIAFNGGTVVGTTPVFEGVEPISYTVNSVTYAPLLQEVTAMRNMLSSFTTAQLATAKNASTFSDVTLAPGESNGGSGTFPTTKAGIAVSTLSTTSQGLVLAAIEPWIQDIDDASAAILRAVYANGISGTYVTWTGSGTSGTSGSFLNANTNYVRIDGPDVWIEFVCQNGVVFPAQIHFHTVWRDRNRDYGKDLTNVTLPVGLQNFDVKQQGKSRLVSWTTANETELISYDVERTNNAADGFTSIGKVAAKNTVSNTYSFNDNSLPTASTVYYRLRISERDGSVRYSAIVPIKINRTKSLSVYPNPAKNLVTLILTTEVTKATISVIDPTGKTVKALTNQKGKRFDVDISGLTAGNYYIQLTENGKTTSINFVKQ